MSIVVASRLTNRPFMEEAVNMHIDQGTLALQRSLTDVVAEYDTKRAGLVQAIKDFEKAGTDLKMSVTIAGVFGDRTIDTGHVYERELQECLLKSAWKHVYDGLDIDRLASPNDKNRWKQSLEKPAPFTIENIRGTFGPFIQDPRGNILRGLAEVFGNLDPAFKSHDKMKIGVRGLPRRIVMRGVSDYGYGKDQVESILNALAALQGKPLITWREIHALMAGPEDILRADGVLPANRTWDKPEPIKGRGIILRRFQNNNGHLFFDTETLRDVNRGLAEFYGDVLPDCAEAKPAKAKPGTAVSKDLQYYPTPAKLADDIVAEIYGLPGAMVLEPSCGCGRLMDALRKVRANVYGIEVDPVRAARARAKGHTVMLGNFLETVPPTNPAKLFDQVLMNPPFCGKHYAKHVEHALKFLKPGGRLTAILPVTARYDHGLVSGKWRDLPVASFSESGTNICTTVLSMTAPE